MRYNSFLEYASERIQGSKMSPYSVLRVRYEDVPRFVAFLPQKFTNEELFTAIFEVSDWLDMCQSMGGGEQRESDFLPDGYITVFTLREMFWAMVKAKVIQEVAGTVAQRW
jgi:hypothetical protein